MSEEKILKKPLKNNWKSIKSNIMLNEQKNTLSQTVVRFVPCPVCVRRLSGHFLWTVWGINVFMNTFECPVSSMCPYSVQYCPVKCMDSIMYIYGHLDKLTFNDCIKNHHICTLYKKQDEIWGVGGWMDSTMHIAVH